jgi:hypothetical protein
VTTQAEKPEHRVFTHAGEKQGTIMWGCTRAWTDAIAYDSEEDAAAAAALHLSEHPDCPDDCED